MSTILCTTKWSYSYMDHWSLYLAAAYEEREGDTDTAQAPVAAPGAPPITKVLMILLGAYSLCITFCHVWNSLGVTDFLSYYFVWDVDDNLWKWYGLEQDFLTISTGKRKHDEISSGQYYIPQRDGAVDDELSTSMGETCENEVSPIALRKWHDYIDILSWFWQVIVDVLPSLFCSSLTCMLYLRLLKYVFAWFQKRQNFYRLGFWCFRLDINPRVHPDQGREVLGNWQAERSVGRSEDLRLWLQYRRSADAAIEQLIHAKLLQGLSGVAQLDGIDDEYDDVGVWHLIVYLTGFWKSN